MLLGLLAAEVHTGHLLVEAADAGGGRGKAGRRISGIGGRIRAVASGLSSRRLGHAVLLRLRRAIGGGSRLSILGGISTISRGLGLGHAILLSLSRCAGGVGVGASSELISLGSIASLLLLALVGYSWLGSLSSLCIVAILGLVGVRLLLRGILAVAVVRRRHGGRSGQGRGCAR